jgi:hypothetical protein
MHYYASIIRCISILCCIIMHLVHVIHSCALPYVCILYVMHISAFRCMLMRCILTMMHSCVFVFQFTKEEQCLIWMRHAWRDDKMIA